jgi:uncharacterized protein
VHLTIIAKAPVPGRVKTRLCPPCTPDQAAGFAETVAAIDAAAAHIPGDVRKVLLLDGESQLWMPSDYEVVAQRGDGLGERLNNGFAELGRGLIVGMDTPRATRGLSAAVAALARGDDVIGLAVDGGYWVIGLANPDGREFDDVPMSASNTGLAQIRRLHRLGRRVHLLATARDLDDVADLRALATSGDEGEFTAAARRVLATVES